MLIDELMDSISRLCQMYAQEQVARAAAASAGDVTIHDHCLAQAHRHAADVDAQYRTVTDAIIAAVPPRIDAEPFMPARPLATGHVELHTRDQLARPVVLYLPGARAIAVGAHLITQGAVALDRAGIKVYPALPPIHPDVAPATTADAQRCDGEQGNGGGTGDAL